MTTIYPDLADLLMPVLTFNATLSIIGINPYVSVPDELLQQIFTQAGKDKGPIPVRGAVNGKNYTQTLVKYSGMWRLYINTEMLKDSPKRIGETLEITIEHDPEERIIPAHPRLTKALENSPEAEASFKKLPPSLQKEIIRYFSYLKTEDSIQKNLERAIDFLLGKGSFVGRKSIPKKSTTS